MNSAPCQLCSDLRSRIELRTAAELSRLIQVLRDGLQRGAIVDITQPAHCPSGDFKELAIEGPWPDYVEYYFRCVACSWRFRLAVDTSNFCDGNVEGELEPYQ